MYTVVLFFGDSEVSCTDDNLQSWCLNRDMHQIWFDIEFDEYTPVAPLPGKLVPANTFSFNKDDLPFFWVCDFGTETSFYEWLEGGMNNVPVALFQILAPADSQLLIDKVKEARSLSVGVGADGNLVYLYPDGTHFETFLQQNSRENKSLLPGSFKGGAAKGKIGTIGVLFGLGYLAKKWKNA